MLVCHGQGVVTWLLALCTLLENAKQYFLLSSSSAGPRRMHGGDVSIIGSTKKSQ